MQLPLFALHCIWSLLIDRQWKEINVYVNNNEYKQSVCGSNVVFATTYREWSEVLWMVANRKKQLHQQSLIKQYLTRVNESK